MKKSVVPMIIAGALAGAIAGAALAQPSGLAMLDKLDRGEWELRFRDDARPAQRVCLGDARQFIQLRHANLACRRVIVEDSPSEVIVQYTCPGNGYGRTSIRRETGQLIQLDSQGIAGGTPFAFAAEVRRVGQCRN